LIIKAVFLDFYGTVVHEDDDVIPIICNEIVESSNVHCTIKEVGHYWWQEFSRLFHSSYGSNFDTQRNIGTRSLKETIRHFESTQIAEEIIRKQFDHWQKPVIFEDSRLFVEACSVPIIVVSNIDTKDVMNALQFHRIQVDGVITSEDVKSYKPRQEIFDEALKRFNLKNNEVIHVGDSLNSDIQGAQSAGIPAVWINRKNRFKPEHINPDYIIRELIELKGIVGSS